jgi:hypothetical protein
MGGRHIWFWDKREGSFSGGPNCEANSRGGIRTNGGGNDHGYTYRNTFGKNHSSKSQRGDDYRGDRVQGSIICCLALLRDAQRSNGKDYYGDGVVVGGSGGDVDRDCDVEARQHDSAGGKMNNVFLFTLSCCTLTRMVEFDGDPSEGVVIGSSIRVNQAARAKLYGRTCKAVTTGVLPHLRWCRHRRGPSWPIEFERKIVNIRVRDRPRVNLNTVSNTTYFRDEHDRQNFWQPGGKSDSQPCRSSGWHPDEFLLLCAGACRMTTRTSLGPINSVGPFWESVC